MNQRLSVVLLPSLLLLLLLLASVFASRTTGAADQIIQSITNDILSWQQQHAGEKKSSAPPDRPFVTLTYAQSLDGKIAVVVANGDKDASSSSSTSATTSTSSSNFAISGLESLRMTHALRSIHDGILVGGKTLSVDNPRLNNRFWDVDTGTTSDPLAAQPRPVVLDTHLQHIKALGKNCRAQNILICCSREAAATVDMDSLPDHAALLPCSVDSETGRIHVQELLESLKRNYNIQSLMVEGGASILSSFYGQPELVNCICITVSPKLLLWTGLPSVTNNAQRSSSDRHIILDHDAFASSRFSLLGKDTIFLGRLDHQMR